ncbi:hypothetical protein F5144DRAFT_313003 [Chaetomium tenue]|uniref:Uncharacterized protein n=1 Tax=Chaetomium tenue TaxID=1854479 RepID=A0ACB7P6M6_9PEZI|nr:hypothetical protein F5144DRAFT_313003 [Chaetomium globosum]
MGNAQSAEAPRRTSQRLSKPKTGNHATSGLLSPSAFSNNSRRYSNAPLPNPPAPSSTVASTPTTSSAGEISSGLGQHIDGVMPSHPAPASQKESKRRSLFRSRSTRAASSAQPSHAGGLGSRIADRMNRTSSMTYESAVAYYGQTSPESQLPRVESHKSWNYDLTSYEAKRLLNLAEEPQLEHTAAMSENRAMAVTETTWKSSNPAHPPSAPITRTNSDASLYMPVRRRSIIRTPGVATRSSSMRDIPPPPRPSVRHSLPLTPSLSRQHSVESYRSGIMSMPPPILDSDSAMRVATPCEDKYLSIGAFKLGSLCITNGSPSPVTPDIDNAHENGGWGAGHTVARDNYTLRAQGSEGGVTTVFEAQDSIRSPKFLNQISQSPSSSPIQSQPMSPTLQTTSKMTAQEAQLFDLEPSPEYSSVEILDVRLDPNAKPPHTQTERPAGAGMTRNDSGFVSTASPASEASCKLLAKADSGYSSNVSLRSFQVKPRGSENGLVPAASEKQPPRPSNPGGGPMGSGNQNVLHQTDVLYPTTPEKESPPPVPPKDAARYSSVPQPRLNGTQNTVSVNASEESRANSTRTARHALSPIATRVPRPRGPMSPGSELRSPESSKSSISDQSGSPRTRQPGRLQRLLSGARRSTASPPTTQVTHTPEQDGVRPLPQAVRFPSAAKRLALKSRSSLDTLKTIFSVGSTEANLEAVNTADGLDPILTSSTSPMAHALTRKPITRKPVPIRQESTADGTQTASNSRANGGGNVISPVGAQAPVPPAKSSRRTLSLTYLGERGAALDRRGSDFSFIHSTADLPSPPLPSPVAKAVLAESNNGTPQSATPLRRPLSLRVPPSLSRKASRESIQIYPAAHILTSKSSMESIHSRSSSQPGVGSSFAHSRTHSGVSMDPRRLQSFRQRSPQTSPYNSPVRETQADHGMTGQGSQTFSRSGSRHNSISSIHSEGVYRSVNTNGWQIRTAQQQTLRHRASFDGYGYQQWFPQAGHPPSMSNGYTAPTKPSYGPRNNGQLGAAATWSRSQADAAAGQWYQSGQNPPYVPRGHYRNRSMGDRSGRGPNAPYRVLHSYNSPAYRHAPIWG